MYNRSIRWLGHDSRSFQASKTIPKQWFLQDPFSQYQHHEAEEEADDLFHH
jgi:hypothetical protein